ncbi:MAG: c-type cytochrome domain-containing protein [Verrucomicrobiota bacterium]
MSSFYSRLAGVLAVLTGLTAHAADKVTYDEHVLPVFRNSCLKCHNPNEKKGDLDISTFSGVLAGGGSGAAVASGDPDASKLVKAITHAEEPFMPPNSPRMADKEIDIIKKWIAGGLLESSGSKAIASNKPKVDLAAANTSTGKPDGPPPMPQDLLLDPVVHTERTSASTGMASSPWAPIVALGAPKQILLYNTDNLELAGVLPFPEGYPSDIKFSRNGKLVLCGGGYGAKAGLVVVWDVTTGERMLTVGDEFDSVLAADISSDQKWIALGGPARMVNIYSTSTAELEHAKKKHTDWVTAMEFSPDSKYLATGDRNGGVVVWESASGQEVYTLNGHRAGITAITWRGSELVASGSEDGTIKLWSMRDGNQARTWNAHGGGVLSARFTHDGRLVSCGRDNQISVWDANANRQRSVNFTNQLPVRATFSHDGNRVIASDYSGRVAVWNTADGKPLGNLSLNPLPLAERIELAVKEIDDALTDVDKAAAGVAAAEAELQRAESLQSDVKKTDAAREKVRMAKVELDKANANVVKARAELAELKTAQFNVTVFQARDELAKKQREHEKLLASVKDNEDAVAKATNALAKAKKRTNGISDQLDGWNNVLKQDKRNADQATAEFKKAQQSLTKLEAKLNRAKAELAKAEADAAKTPDNQRIAEAVTKQKKGLEPLQAEFDAAQKLAAGKQAEADRLTKELEKTRGELASTQKEAEQNAKQIKTLTAEIKQAETDARTAKSNAERLAREIEHAKAQAEQLAAEYKELKTASAETRKEARL